MSLSVAAAATSPSPAVRTDVTARAAELTRRIPLRPSQALSGSQFVASIRGMDSHHREEAVRNEILRGNVPSFLRRLVPVDLSVIRSSRTFAATIFVMPDYLSIGSDDDYIRMPMNLETATDIAAEFGYVLPTRKIVNAIYVQSAHHFVPQPLPPGPQMNSTEYYARHNEMIEGQARAEAVKPGALVSGHKKDVVLTNLLARTPGRIAIYGWHRVGGNAIQPLSTVHGTCYEDYSHGIRLVSEMALVDGAVRRVQDILQDSASASLLSDEGAIRSVFASASQPHMMLATFTPGYCNSESGAAH